MEFVIDNNNISKFSSNDILLIDDDFLKSNSFTGKIKIDIVNLNHPNLLITVRNLSDENIKLSLLIQESILKKIEIQDNIVPIYSILITQKCKIEKVFIERNISIDSFEINHNNSIYHLVFSNNILEKGLSITQYAIIYYINIRDSIIKKYLAIISTDYNHCSITQCNIGNQEKEYFYKPSEIRQNKKYESELFISRCIFYNQIILDHSEYKSLKLYANIFNQEFTIDNVIIHGTYNIEQCAFKKFPSKIQNLSQKEDIKTCFLHTDFTNLIWQTIDFKQTSFIDFDIKNATFKSCIWQEVKTLFNTRLIVLDEKNLDLKSLDNLKKLKKIYADFKTNFQEKGDFIKSGQFHISEQFIKTKIAQKEKKGFDYAVLYMHNLLSVYGESLSKNLLILVASLFLFATIYLFAGFKINDTVINYNLGGYPDWNLICDFFHALILALKNLFPFPTNTKLYISVDENYAGTQVVEILQKVLSLIIWASLGQTIAKYLKK